MRKLIVVESKNGKIGVFIDSIQNLYETPEDSDEDQKIDNFIHKVVIETSHGNIYSSSSFTEVVNMIKE